MSDVKRATKKNTFGRKWKNIKKELRERRIARQFKLICHLKREAAGM